MQEDTKTREVTAAAMAKYIDGNTIAIVGSAPNVSRYIQGCCESLSVVVVVVVVVVVGGGGGKVFAICLPKKTVSTTLLL